MKAERLLEFIGGLTEPTRTRHIRWATEGSSSFLLSIPSGSVRIRSMDGDGMWPYELQILDENGVSVETAETEVEREAGQGMTLKNTPLSLALSELYEAARDNSLNVETVMENILRDVEKGLSGTGDFPTSPTDDDIPF